MPVPAVLVLVLPPVPVPVLPPVVTAPLPPLLLGAGLFAEHAARVKIETQRRRVGYCLLGTELALVKNVDAVDEMWVQ